MIELEKKIGHKSVMSICEFFIGRDETAHIVDQEIADMEGIGDASVEGFNGMGQLFAADLSANVAAVLWVSVYMIFLRGYGCGTTL